jgi:transposase InsO family protein
VVGWPLRGDMTSNIVIDALRMAWFKHHPDKQVGLLFHSDRGSQHASGAFRGVLQEYGITSSMSRRGNCWDTVRLVEDQAPARAALGDAAPGQG